MKKLFENGQITVSENGSGEIFICCGETKIRVSPGAGNRLCITNHDGYLLPGELHGLPCIDAVSHEWMRDRCGGIERKRGQKLRDHWETQIGKPIEEVMMPSEEGIRESWPNLAEFEDVLGAESPLMFDDGECVAWGRLILRHLGEEQFKRISRLGVECLDTGKWAVVTRYLTLAEIQAKFGPMTKIVRGPQGGLKGLFFGKKLFESEIVKKQLREENTPPNITLVLKRGEDAYNVLRRLKAEAEIKG